MERVDNFGRGRLARAARAAFLWLNRLIGITRDDTCWSCRWHRELGDEREIVGCDRPSLVVEELEMGIPIVSFAVVSEGTICDEFEFPPEEA